MIGPVYIGKEDYTELYRAYLRSEDWKDKRHLVMLRDNNTCQACFSAPATQVHHKTYAHVFREPLFDLEAVCDACHEMIHTTPNIAQLVYKYNRESLASEEDMAKLIAEMKARTGKSIVTFNEIEEGLA